MYHKINNIIGVETCHGTSLHGRLSNISRCQNDILMVRHNGFPKNVMLFYELCRLLFVVFSSYGKDMVSYSTASVLFFVSSVYILCFRVYPCAIFSCVPFFST